FTVLFGYGKMQSAFLFSFSGFLFLLAISSGFIKMLFKGGGRFVGIMMKGNQAFGQVFILHFIKHIPHKFILFIIHRRRRIGALAGLPLSPDNFIARQFLHLLKKRTQFAEFFSL